jgi:hypothetical protein
MWKTWGCVAALTAALTIGVAVASVAQTAQPTDTYTWNGELVSIDGTTMTLKARVAYAEALTELKQFKPGERVWVVWSGVHDYSDAVRQVRRASAGKIEENLVMPVELVSPDATNQFITIRVRVPEGRATTLKAMKPGEWVTVTSRHRPPTEAEAVVDVRPYGSTISST